MPLGFHVPQWCALHAELGALVKETGARWIVILDAWNDLWCMAPLDWHAVVPLCDAIYRDHIAPADLAKGGRLSVGRRGEPGGYAWIAESYATVYVAVLFLARDDGMFAARASLQRARPYLTELTVALPPSDPQDPHGGAKMQRA